MTQAAFDDDLTACARLVERGDPDRFAATMAAPVAARHVLFPIYAFNVEVARAPWVTQEPMIAEMRLQWWRDALAEIDAGGFVRRHEVVTPLALVLQADGGQVLDRLILARRWDIYCDAFEDDAHFTRYIEDTAGGLVLASAQALAAASGQGLTPGLRQAALDAGYAQGLAAFLRAVPALEDKSRIPLVDGRAEAVRALAKAGLARLARARATAIPRALRPAFTAVWEARALLNMAGRTPERVGQGALQTSELRRRAGLIWTAATGRF